MSTKMKKPSLKAYRKEKLKMLDEFCIPITTEIKNALAERETEIAIDNYCHSLIANYLN